MKRRKSLRQRLKELVQQHPDWSNKELAEALGQSRDSVRGALSRLKIRLATRLPPGRPKQTRR